MRMSSSRAPSSSATICASVVSRPCPCDDTPNVAVTPPVESIRMVAASVPVLMGMPGDAEMREPMPVSSAYDAMPMPTQRPSARASACARRKPS
jgi:hypothetical protein